ncbi:DUF3551 domain-containing protein [Bradyrhizobium australiense]|uniref:DUF3551 domain-containing protein n=1 Tax=Bradyrhizobium australiense TaxID=2721161 RepID=A0A7Y4LVE5_9BRAD|nr:DUF3551 domain-containing protein [Bradyrhizobium australiense]
MQRSIFGIILIVLAAVTMTLATPGEAKSRKAHWCSKIEGKLHCSYYTQEQCQASVSGRMGYCVHRP